jgi:SNF2 family DNA or RNA helicase
MEKEVFELMGNWIIFEHHIAIEFEDNILHPCANEIYSFMEQKDITIDCIDPRKEFVDIRFSKIGAPICCNLFTDVKRGYICIELLALRKKEQIPVDLINGEIVDHCISDQEWFYLSGNIVELSELMKSVGIMKTGKITMGQYIELIKKDCFNHNGLINNNVKIDMLSKPVDLREKEPNQLKAKLYKYQKIGYLWMKYMISESRGCILGDEMGLGKTLQVITIFLDLLKNKEVPILVVAPVSLLENWKRECEKFAPSIRTYIHHGSNRTGRYLELLKHDVVIVSYNTSVSDLSMLKMIDWKLVVLDEAQNIKNPYSERAKSIKKLPRNRSIAVTGTPFENHVTDIWSLVDFAVPGLLGTLGSFKNNISDDLLGAEKIEPILSPVMIRRLVIDVATDLPEKIVIPQPIDMSESESNSYEKYRNDAKSEMNDKAVNLGLLQKLRMFCTHPSLCEGVEGGGDPFSISVKYQRLCEIIEEILNRNEKVIVFTSYKKMFDIFMEDIPKRFGIKLWKINGETPVSERQSIIDEFNNIEGTAMLVLNPRAAGTGLNITGANHVIHYNLEWNPAMEDQSSARAYRRGQKKNVFIYRLFYVNTVEQVVNERIERKRLISNKAVIGNLGENEDRNDILAALELAPTIR